MIEAGNPIGELVTGRQWDQLRDALRPMHPSDIADVIIAQPTETEGIIFRLLPRQKAARVFAYLPTAEQRHLLDSLSNEQVRHLLAEMSPDDRTHLLEEMPAEVTRELLLQLDPRELQAARQLLGYPENTAGRYMTPKYAWIYPDMTAAAALDKIRHTGQGKETLNWIYVIDAGGKLVEDVRLANLVLAPAESNVMAIDDPELVSVRATDDRDTVLKAFEKYDRGVLPVTNGRGYMLGIITVDDVLDIAEQRATEDIQKLGGSEVLGAFLGAIGFFRIVLWQRLRFVDYGPHYLLVALTVCGALIGVVGFGTLTGSMLPFILRKLGFDPATASAPFVATLVDVTGLCIYFGVALLILRGTLL